MTTSDATADQRLDALTEALHRRTSSDRRQNKAAITATVDPTEQQGLAAAIRQIMKENNHRSADGRTMTWVSKRARDLHFRHIINYRYLVSVHDVVPNLETLELEPAENPLAIFVLADEHHMDGNPPDGTLDAAEELDQLAGLVLMSDREYQAGGHTAWIWCNPQTHQELKAWKEEIDKAVVNSPWSATSGKAIHPGGHDVFITESLHLAEGVYLVTLTRMLKDLTNRRLYREKDPAAQLLVANAVG